MQLTHHRFCRTYCGIRLTRVTRVFSLATVAIAVSASMHRAAQADLLAFGIPEAHNAGLCAIWQRRLRVYAEREFLLVTALDYYISPYSRKTELYSKATTSESMTWRATM